MYNLSLKVPTRLFIKILHPLPSRQPRSVMFFDDIFIYEAKSISGDQFTTTDPDFGSPAESGDDLYGDSASEAKSVPIDQSKTTDLHYGFGLGRLYHKSSFKMAHMEDTGFYVLCNAVDKSIWIAFDFEPYGETGEIKPVQPEYGNPYGRLPEDN